MLNVYGSPYRRAVNVYRDTSRRCPIPCRSGHTAVRYVDQPCGVVGPAQVRRVVCAGSRPGVPRQRFMGELFLDVPEAIMSVVIDTSLVYTASQLAYRIAWKPLLEARVQAFQSRRAAAAAAEHTA